MAEASVGVTGEFVDEAIDCLSNVELLEYFETYQREYSC